MDSDLLAIEALEAGYDIETWKFLVQSGDVESKVWNVCENDALIAQLYQDGSMITGVEYKDDMEMMNL